MKRILSSAIASALLVALSVAVPGAVDPAKAVGSANISLFTGDGATGTYCLQITGNHTNLAYTGCGDWNNRANSFRAYLAADRCVSLYSGGAYADWFMTVYGPATHNGSIFEISTSRDNTASSLRFGVKYVTTSGATGCRY